MFRWDQSISDELGYYYQQKLYDLLKTQPNSLFKSLFFDIYIDLYLIDIEPECIYCQTEDQTYVISFDPLFFQKVIPIDIDFVYDIITQMKEQYQELKEESKEQYQEEFKEELKEESKEELKEEYQEFKENKKINSRLFKPTASSLNKQNSIKYKPIKK